MKILCVAEKPSIARAVSEILSGGRFTTTGTANKYIKNYKFTSRIGDWGECDVLFTSVAGHLTEADFDVQWRKWNTCAPIALFEEARIIEKIPEGSNNRDLANDRAPRVYMKILSKKGGKPRACLFGQIAIERENTLDLRLNAPLRREIGKSKSKELDSIISKDSSDVPKQ